ncbi:hypothetical protein B0H13DRAFT_1879218 [Mycena leptocephala]|nr:hypothetical protein B0H13DRAFT_1879218 [Mycena leptocephala]
MMVTSIARDFAIRSMRNRQNAVINFNSFNWTEILIMFAAHFHLRDGQTVNGKMLLHPCTAKEIVYTSKTQRYRKKPGYAAKEDVKKCVVAGGILGEMGSHLNSSRTTQAVLGTSLAIKHPAFRDTRRLRDEVSNLKSDGSPGGLLWAGAMKIAVTMNPELAAPIHDAGVWYLEGDITFKHTKGEMNEWKAVNPPDLPSPSPTPSPHTPDLPLIPLTNTYIISFVLTFVLHLRSLFPPQIHATVLFTAALTSALIFSPGLPGELPAIWYTLTIERVTAARIYTNLFTKEAFTHLFDGFSSSVKQVTGKSVQFKAFHRKGIHFDKEAAQVQGLGAWLSKMVLDYPALHALFLPSTLTNLSR